MSKHADHAVFPVADGWHCEACPSRFPTVGEAMAHVVAHQYQVADPKPLPERAWNPRR